MGEPFFDDVVVMQLIPYGDNDQVVRLFGHDQGRVAGFARNARTSKRRFPGLMAPSLGRAQLKARRGDMLDLLELDANSRLLGVAADLRAWGFCGYAIELVERFVPEGAPQPELFRSLVDCLCGLATHGAKAPILRAFELRLLDTLGVLPDLSGVVDDPGMPTVAYDPERGHLLATARPDTIEFDENARQAALFLLDAAADDAVELPIDDDVLKSASRLFSSWLRRQNVRLRSLEVLREMPR